MNRAKAARSGNYIRTHAALRGVAALLVVAYHLQFAAVHHLAIETATSFFNRCYLLVDLFFILSGFIISYTHDAGGARTMRKAEVYGFYVARVARIYPLHVFCLCFIVASTLALTLLSRWHHGEAMAIAIDPAAMRSFVEELLLLQAWIPGAPRWNIPSWSISAEAFAYLTFPLILLARHHLPRWLNPLWLVLPLGFYLYVLHGDRSLDITAGLAPLRCLSGFIIGILLCEHRDAACSWSEARIAGCQSIAVAGSVVMLAMPWPDPLIIPCFALLVFTTWQDRGPLRALLLHRALLRSAELSYSIYLTHVGVIAIVFPVWYWLDTRYDVDADMARLAFLLGCYLAVIVVSRWTHAMVEERGRRLVRSLFSGQGRQARGGPRRQS